MKLQNGKPLPLAQANYSLCKWKTKDGFKVKGLVQSGRLPRDLSNNSQVHNLTKAREREGNTPQQCKPCSLGQNQQTLGPFKIRCDERGRSNRVGGKQNGGGGHLGRRVGISAKEKAAVLSDMPVA